MQSSANEPKTKSAVKEREALVNSQASQGGATVRTIIFIFFLFLKIKN